MLRKTAFLMLLVMALAPVAFADEPETVTEEVQAEAPNE